MKPRKKHASAPREPKSGKALLNPKQALIFYWICGALILFVLFFTIYSTF